MSKTYSYLTQGDEIARTINDVKSVKIRRGSVILLGRKNTALMAIPENTLVAVWRTDGTEGDRYIVSLQRQRPVEVGGVEGIESKTNKFGQAAFMILEADDGDLPVAVVSAHQVLNIRRADTSSSRPAIGQLALAQHPSGGLLMVALDPTLDAGAPNVFGHTMDPQGNWLDWEPLGSQHLTDVAATSTGANLRLFGCDEGTAGANIFQADYSPSDTTWELVRDGILTTTSATVLTDGRVVAAGLNAALPAPDNNCFFGVDPTPAQTHWAGVGAHALDITCAPTADGRLAAITVSRDEDQRSVTTVHVGGLYAGVWTRKDLNRDLTSLTATRAADGRINVFGIAANSWSGNVDHFVQDSPDTWSGTWSTMRISLQSIASATALDGRMHLVGLTEGDRHTAELLHRRETEPGGPWSHWTAIG